MTLMHEWRFFYCISRICRRTISEARIDWSIILFEPTARTRVRRNMPDDTDKSNFLIRTS